MRERQKKLDEWEGGRAVVGVVIGGREWKAELEREGGGREEKLESSKLERGRQEVEGSGRERVEKTRREREQIMHLPVFLST